MRGSGSTYSSRIDIEVGAENIAGHFADIYSELYNRVELGEQFEQVSKSIKEAVTEESVVQLDRVNVEIVQEALKHMKCNKHDALFTIASDCLVNGVAYLI